MNSSGYSGTPLVKKLGIKEGFRLRIVHPPDGYFSFFADLPQNLEFLEDDESKVDFIHYFVIDASKLQNEIGFLKGLIEESGMIWISWPKKSSKIKSNLDGNKVREIGLKAGLVDIKVCAVNEIWSGLKFVIPVKDRGL
ncbi:DUF3052 domain-containing protein [Algoriphagus sediminis]|uniref:DUF3052 domain-containing protein n=1 Tax=Algoriphagus sediminis TaxID=3057113 RepID=A0ABT7Y9Z9_9BACT|nr:DUF3052 domain-containing protein [Algoriphagus sediminis]MDN3203344.1 DUF3052 domain-containing protein [Algoriphagus sediminis]